MSNWKLFLKFTKLITGKIFVSESTLINKYMLEYNQQANVNWQRSSTFNQKSSIVSLSPMLIPLVCLPIAIKYTKNNFYNILGVINENV